MPFSAGPDLTATEAASVTGVPVRQVNRIIDAGMLRTYVKSKGHTRFITTPGLLGLRLAYLTASTLTPSARRRIIAKAMAHRNDATIEEAPIQIDIRTIVSQIETGIDRLERAREFVSSDPDIMAGHPVFKGTRVLVYDIADMLKNGEAIESIRLAFPQLTTEQIIASSDYAMAYPRRGRPAAKPEWRPGEVKSSKSFKLTTSTVES